MTDALIDQLAQLAEGSGYELQDVLDEAKVQRVLEATAYDVETAAQLYWDDFLATRAMEQQQQQQEQQELRDDDAAGEPEIDEDINDGEDEEEESTDEEEPRPRNPEEVPVIQQRQAIHSDEESAPANNGDPSHVVQLRRRLFVNPRRRKRSRRRRAEESVVSEEEQEGLGSWTVVASPKPHSKVPASKRRRRDQNAVDDDYLSDNDWVWGDGHFASSPATLSKFIWGSGRAQPHTWLRAGLSICKDAGAVVLSPPHSEDLCYKEWTEAAAPTQPYHCRSLTVLTSVVNALLYSGASVQPGPCIGVAREPLLEVVDTLDDCHPREMTLRLMDAITVLIYIAAKTSIERKAAALEDAPDTVRSRLQLVPVTSSFGVSFTNLHDLPSYVKSNIQAFTSPGGISRLMDTLVRIHGISAVRRCWPGGSLVKCTCCDRITATTKKDLELDTTPRDLDCLAGNDRVLVDWLLTGRVRPRKFDMYEELKIGILSSVGMLKPPSSSPCNVWLLQGPTQWSVLVQNHIDEKDADASMCRHINSWYREDHVTNVTVTHRKVCSTDDDTATSREFTIHPDDRPLYPDRYRLWRYQFSSSSVWTPYVRLTRAQQECVERQEGPALATLLQARWPQARVDTDVIV